MHRTAELRKFSDRDIRRRRAIALGVIGNTRRRAMGLRGWSREEAKAQARYCVRLLAQYVNEANRRGI